MKFIIAGVAVCCILCLVDRWITVFTTIMHAPCTSIHNTLIDTIMIMCTSIPQGKLFYYPLGQGEDSVLVINTDTLQEETSLDLDGSI